jgi:hypothetical protein
MCRSRSSSTPSTEIITEVAMVVVEWQNSHHLNVADDRGHHQRGRRKRRNFIVMVEVVATIITSLQR